MTSDFFFVSLQNENEYQLETMGCYGTCCFSAHNINRVILYVPRYIYGLVADRQFARTVGKETQGQR